jgi:hypothetical protein
MSDPVTVTVVLYIVPFLNAKFGLVEPLDVQSCKCHSQKFFVNRYGWVGEYNYGLPVICPI